MNINKKVRLQKMPEWELLYELRNRNATDGLNIYKDGSIADSLSKEMRYFYTCVRSLESNVEKLS